MKVQITNGMFVALIINLVYAKGIGLTQGIMAREVGSDMWIATIFSTIQGVGMMVLTALIIARTPDKDFVGYTDQLFGKWAGKLVAVLMFLFFLGAFGGVMITFVYHLMDYFLPEAPVLLFVVVALVVGLYSAYLGLEVTGRMALVGIFSIFALNVLLLLGAFDEFDIRELMPVLESGFWNTLYASRQNDTDWAMASMMAGILLPFVKGQKVWRRSAPAGIIAGGFMVLIWPMLEAGVLSPEVASQYTVSCMQLARSAEIGLFIHRYEMIMIVFLAISALVQVTICLFCASVAVKQAFGLSDSRKVLLPVAMVLGAFGYWIVLDHSRAMIFLGNYWPYLSLPLAFGLPIILWLVGFLRKQKWTVH